MPSVRHLALLLVCAVLSGAAGRADAAGLILVPEQHASLQAAIDAAVAGDVVLVGPGIHAGPLDFVGKAITVTSRLGAQATIVDAGGAGTVVTFKNGEGPDSQLVGFTLRGGQAHDGGGVLCVNASPLIRHCVIEDCLALDTGGPGFDGISTGGGVSVFGGSLRLEWCTVRNCHAGDGSASSAAGGVHATLFSAIELRHCVIEGNVAHAPSKGGGVRCGNGLIEHCTIRNNSAEFGGGVHLSSFFPPTVLMRDCRVIGNTGGALGGGGLWEESATLQGATIEDCTFADNDAGSGARGGGAYFFRCRPTLRRCRFLDNRAEGGGGGLTFDDVDAVLVDLLLARNEAPGAPGAALLLLGGDDVTLQRVTVAEHDTGTSALAVGTASTVLTLRDTIAWNPALPAGTEIVAAAGSSVAATYSDVHAGTGESWFGMGCLDTNPLFAQPGSEDWQLGAGSPCLDHGDPSSPPDPDGSVADMGSLVTTLPFAPNPWSEAGGALPGTAGLPQLAGTGTPTPGETVQLLLTAGRPSAPVLVVLGLSLAMLPLKGGVLVPAPDAVFTGADTDPTGTLVLTGIWPPGLAPGTSVWSQFWIVDPCGPSGLAASVSVAVTTP